MHSFLDVPEKKLPLTLTNDVSVIITRVSGESIYRNRPNMDQLLEYPLEHPLFLRLTEGRVHGEHSIFGDSKFFSLLRH